MGHAASTLSRSQSQSSTLHRSRSSPMAAAGGGGGGTNSPLAAQDFSLDLPDEVLALVFHSLPAADRNSCSLVCRRWLLVDAGARNRLSLDARAALSPALPSLAARFGPSVAKLALRCDRRSGDSVGDDSLVVIARGFPRLVRLKLRGCRRLSDAGLAAFAAAAPGLKKLSCASCTFGPRAIAAVLEHCVALEDLSLKRLRGLQGVASASAAAVTDAEENVKFPSSASLKSVCLKDLYNAQCFVPLIVLAKNLASLKILRCCSGSWDSSLEEIAACAPNLLEIHLEKLQFSDRGLTSVACFAQLEVLFLVKTPECSDVGVSAVAAGCPRLRKVHLDGWRTNRIGDVALRAIANGCPDLQELVLIGINPTVQSLELLSAGCLSLERLALCGCETVGDAEVACLASRCAALRKLCIKGCPVSDRGMEALARGCPNLVKVKLKRCRGVTSEGVEWLKAVRGESFAVSLDLLEQAEVDAVSLSENGAAETVAADLVDEPVNHIGDAMADQVAALDIASSSNGQSSSQANSRMRNFVTSAWRRLSSSGNSSNPPLP